MNSVGKQSLIASSAISSIALGGFLAGLFDIGYAMVRWSWHVPRVIAGGLLGPEALKSENMGVWSFGLFLHFCMTTIHAAIYYAASRRLVFLREHAVVCGLFYGMAVYLGMTLVVVPLSALHQRGPFKLETLVEGLLVHMVLVGLPIALSIRYFNARKAA